MSKRVIAYWLLPTEPARQFLVEAIRQLAARFNAPVFDPHLTAFITPEDSRSPSEVLAEIEDFAITLSTIEIAASEQFTKTLFIRLAKTAALQELGDMIAKLSGASARPLIDPHLSLLYKRLPRRAKEDLVASISLPFREITFRSVRAMRCVSPTRSADDVRAWRLLANQNLKTR